MAGAKKCDACGKLYEVYNSANNKKKPNEFRLVNVDSTGRYYEHCTIDLCPECMDKVMDILNRKENDHV